MFIQDGTVHLGQHGPIICTLLIAIVLDVSDDVQLVHCVRYIKAGATFPYLHIIWWLSIVRFKYDPGDLL